MDLFNKKKLEKMYIENDYYKKSNKNKDEIIKNLQKDNGQLNKNNNALIEENQKLVDWIEKILNEVGIKTKDSYEGQTITIPYYENTKPYYIEGDWNKPSMKQKDIIIPSIRYTKLN